MKTAILLLLLNAAPLLAQPDSHTGPYWNGRAWRSFSELAHVAYLSGYMDALGVCDKDKSPCGMTTGEISEAVTRVYSEPENLILPIPMAVHLVARKAAGTDPAVVAKEAADLRQIARALGRIWTRN